MVYAPRAALWLGAAAIFAFAGCSDAARVVPVNGADSGAGALAPVQAHYAKPRSQAAAVAPAFSHVPYLGGAVVVNPKFYFVFWGYHKFGDPRKVEPLLLDYAKSMGGSAHNDIETQYYQDLNSVKTYITNPANQFGGTWNDDSAVPKVPTDAQIAAEALKAVGHFGYDPNGVYFVQTPHAHNEAAFPTHWCAYHGVTYYQSQAVPYAYLPYMPDGGAGCGAGAVKPPHDESSVDEGVTIMAGHEFGEAITDPSPSTAWDGPLGEIGDQCAWHGIANEPFGTKSYTMQPMASDADNSCVQSYGSQAMPGTQSGDLLYLTDMAKNDVEVLSYPQNRHVATLTGFGRPRAECAGPQGHVWIADTQGVDVIEYSHGGAKPIAALSTPGAPRGCSVNGNGNAIAVTGGDGGVILTVYRHGVAGWRDPTTYTDASIKNVTFCAFDPQGNLFVDGTGKGRAFRLAELPRGSQTLVDLTVNASIVGAGQMQWDGTNLAVGDDRVAPSVIYQLSVSGSTATSVGSTTLKGSNNVEQFWIDGSQVIGPDLNAAVGIWKYPAGGDPVKTITSVRGYGAAVSLAAGSDRK